MPKKILEHQNRNKKVDNIQKKSETELAKAYKKAREDIKKELALLEQKKVLNKDEMFRLGRLKTLQRKVEEKIKEASKETGNLLEENTKEIYKASYTMVGAEINSASATSINFLLIPSAQVARAVKNPLDKVGFIKRDYKNNAKITKELNNIISSGLIRGKSYADIADSIDARFDIGFNNSVRIARTEGHRVREQGTFDAMEKAEKMGVKMMKQWLTASDERVRDSHAELQEVTIPMEEEFTLGGLSAMKPGDFGVPEEDINCRCTLITVIEY